MNDERRHDEPAWVREAILAGRPFHVRNRPAWIHNAINLAALGGVLALAAGVLALGRGDPTWIYTPLAGLAFGWCYFSLVILVVHEASHGMFLWVRDAAARRRWNRLFGVVVAAPFLIDYVRHWELGHNVHHRIPIEPGDPQALNRRTGAPLARDVALLLLVPGYVLVHRLLTPRAWPQELEPGHPDRGRALLGGAERRGRAGVSWAAVGALLYGIQVLAAINEVKGASSTAGRSPTIPTPSSAVGPASRPGAGSSYHSTSPSISSITSITRCPGMR
ncbi:MAG: fatty acid desaturase [Nannocystaceae bacterium]